MKLSRRAFLGATLSTAALPAWAQSNSVPDRYMPQIVDLQSTLDPGEIHVDPVTFDLYWTLLGNRAIKYTVGIGRDDLYETGEFYVGAKKEWPSWTPTPDMIERDPDAYKQYEDGMPGGPDNPLGARALYLFTPERGDTFLRIHGTNQPNTIASRVSNGCVRLINSHVEHLYEQVPLDTRVVLY